MGSYVYIGNLRLNRLHKIGLVYWIIPLRVLILIFFYCDYKIFYSDFAIQQIMMLYIKSILSTDLFSKSLTKTFLILISMPCHYIGCSIITSLLIEELFERVNG